MIDAIDVYAAAYILCGAILLAVKASEIVARKRLQKRARR